jgi:quercetin dioxygenase-like cupin family protein
MHHVRQGNLPFVGSWHEFVGAEQGDTSVSVFLFHGKPGSGPGPHRHAYDEIQFIREGRGSCSSLVTRHFFLRPYRFSWMTSG